MTEGAMRGRGRLADLSPSCRRCTRPGAAARLAALAGVHPGRCDVDMICADCATPTEQRATYAEKARILRRLKRGIPADL